MNLPLKNKEPNTDRCWAYFVMWFSFLPPLISLTLVPVRTPI